MSRYITASSQADIIQYLSEWKTGRYGRKLKWDDVAKASGYTRQALSGNAEIKAAYDEAKQALRDNRTEIDELSNIALENKKLQEEVDRLTEMVEGYEQKYLRWQINAMDLGVTVDQLNKPLTGTFKEHSRRMQES